MSLLLPGLALAGHGFSQAFSDIKWLPEPGITPDAPWYFLDNWGEQLMLAIGDATTKRLTYAREKLAEMKAMIQANDKPAARRAIAAYARHMQPLTNAQPASARPVVEALLEHQYIVSVEYIDWPLSTRPVAGQMMHIAADSYETLNKRLPAATRDALFFKQDEVRWSWEMAELADEQKLEGDGQP